MEENSSSPRRSTEPTHTYKAEDLLVSDEFAWERVPESKSASFCGNVPLRGINKRTGLSVAFTRPCRTLVHRPCAEVKVLTKLSMMCTRVALSDVCYFAVMKTVDLTGNRVADRRYALAKKLKRLVWYVRVDRANGLSYFFASDPLTGRKEPSVFFETDDLLPVVAGAMTLPGVRRIQGSQSGSPKDNHGDQEVEYLGFAGEVAYGHAERIAVEIALAKYGVEVDPLAPTRLDGGITPEQWIDCMQRAWPKAR